MTHMPFPSNENALSAAKQTLAKASSSDKPPWQVIKAAESQPNMFRLHRHNGIVFSYAYCDLREIRMLSAGHLQLFLYGIEKYSITIEGRNLTDLAGLLGECRIKSLEESGPRTFIRAESIPSIDKITVEELTNSAPH